jgi:hypothetical protein
MTVTRCNFSLSVELSARLGLRSRYGYCRGQDPRYTRLYSRLQSPNPTIDMLRPFALSVLKFSLFMSTNINYGICSICIIVRNFWYRIKVQAKAPKEGGWMWSR